ncbi:cytochrome P450 78A5-like [Panicum miliaceum]|uniref:Cytochrome P450 78A5-like n=1 Tax=Panicum miliaceum TaxID=4540 RepID=A0A3L6QV00_PANMI|nr:cytochrome P450 78A5-like [Panicum miliaceum]
MVLTMTTGQEDSLLLLLLPTTSPLPPFLAALVLVAVLLWLSPGGPAWALSRCRRPPSGPPGMVTALSSPVAHPDIQAKAQEELDAVVGRGRGVADADIASLPYIQCIVKETLRMHPPGPLLLWHASPSTTCTSAATWSPLARRRW